MVAVTSTVTQVPATTGGTQPPSVVVVTSTIPQPTTQKPTSTIPTTSSSSTPSPSALSASDSGSGTTSGLSNPAKIAIAVVIPVVVIAAAIFFGLFLWRRRKARKDAAEQRKNEMAEYNYNPNNDTTLAAAAVPYDNGSEAQEDSSGYRGWGATSSNRKASTTLGSNSRPFGMNTSDNGSQPDAYHNGGYNNGGYGAEHYSPDPLMDHPEGVDGVAALGAGAGLARNKSNRGGDIRRGPSNASSAYSTGRPQSEASDDTPGVSAQYYQEEIPYNIYNDAQPTHGPYGDGSYGGNGAQPVIRDVQARRNTRIERAPTFPQNQGGISQNF